MNTQDIENTITKARDLVSKKDYGNIKVLLISILEINDKNAIKEEHWEDLGTLFLVIGDFDNAYLAYKNSGNRASAAFSLIVQGKLDKAKELLENPPKSPLSVWCNFLYDLFAQKLIIRKWPSFLEIRHFMELTIVSLLTLNNQKYIDLLLKRLNKLLDINLDTEKFIGYAYYHFGDLDKAIEILKRSIKKNGPDGEIYFILGQIYLGQNNLNEALSMLENAQLMMPEHYPTKVLLKEVSENLAN